MPTRRPTPPRSSPWILAAVASVLLAGAAAGGPPDSWFDATRRAIVLGNGRDVLARLQGPTWQQVRDDPLGFWRLLGLLEAYGRPLARRDGAATDEIVACLRPLTDAALAATPDSPLARAQSACLTCTEQRWRALRGLPVDVARWREAVDVGREVAALPGVDANMTLQVLRWIGSYAEHPDSDPVDLLAGAARAVADLHERRAEDPEVVIGGGLLFVASARSAVAHGRPADAKAALEAGLVLVKPHLGPADPVRFVGLVHTALIAQAQDLGIEVGDTYRSEEHWTVDGLFAYRLPVSASWATEPPLPEAPCLSLVQRGAEEGCMRRIRVRAWRHGDQVAPGGTGRPVPTANAKALAERLRAVRKKEFREVGESPPLRTAAPAPGVRAGPQFVLAGETAADGWARLTCTLLASKDLLRTVEIQVWEYERGDDGRTEAQFVLSSFAIPQ